MVVFLVQVRHIDLLTASHRHKTGHFDFLARHKSLTLPKATRFSITPCMFAIVAGTIVNSPYLSFTWSAARAKAFLSKRVPSNKPSCSGVVSFRLYTVTPILVTLAGMSA